MFDKLFTFILDQINNIVPFTIVMQFNNGVKYRFGKHVKTVKPGIYFKFPYMEKILQENAVDTTILLPALAIDKLVVRASIGYKVEDMGMYYNNVVDTKSAVSDIGCVVLHQSSIINTKEQMRTVKYGNYLKKMLQENVKGYGIKINYFEVVELTESRTYKLFNEMVRLES